MWDVDRTLLVAGRVAYDAYVAAFTAVTGMAWSGRIEASGRTDLWIAREVFLQHGADLEPHVKALFARYAAEYGQRSAAVAEQATALPGVADVLAGLDRRPGVVQTLVTGNVPAVAAVKVAAAGLDGPLDLAIGGYGDQHIDRSELVRNSRALADAVHGRFADTDVLVVGDTVHDVAAALACGVVAVGVATGHHSAAELAAAGAHHVFDDLSDVAGVVDVLAGRRPMITNR